MKIRLIWPISSSDSDFADAFERYVKRIRHFFPIEVTEVPPERGRQSQSDVAIIRAQSARLLAAIPDRGTTAVVDERGQMLDSLKFARWFERLTTDSPHGINFVLGGDLGIDDQVRQRADKVLSLSAMTFPHQIARIVLVEQIYRACTLMRNIPYHK
jgi:23S rRNA (pseudouridine1915-N3)-methyltransferase